MPPIAPSDTINRCPCGNVFPRGFSGNWERVTRDGRIYARCANPGCGRETEAFFHERKYYWIWPLPGLPADPALI